MQGNQVKTGKSRHTFSSRMRFQCTTERAQFAAPPRYLRVTAQTRRTGELRLHKVCQEAAAEVAQHLDHSEQHVATAVAAK